MIIGIDEVGRGCWAGPLLVVAARPRNRLPAGLRDSKLLTKKQREALLSDIRAAFDIGEGWVQAIEIDAIGLTAAMRLGVQRALTALKAKPNETIIMDGPINYCPGRYTKVQCLIKADRTQPIVSAASVYAKVRRDQYMTKMSVQFPEYQFASHVGYGTKVHREALATYGACTLHRLSYKPMKVEGWQVKRA